MQCLKSALLKWLTLFMLNEREKIMMAMLYAQRIMNGKMVFTDVPRLLKDKVAEILIESGMEELVTEWTP